MSAPNAVFTNASSSVPGRRISRLALASLLCGLATPVVGFFVLSDVGSDSSDLLTLTLPLLLFAAVMFCILAHCGIWKAPERLAGTGYAKAGAILATVTLFGMVLLVTAT